jgi:hypothetical protein
MVQDFTNVGIQPKVEDASTRLAHAIRTGLPSSLDPSRPSYEMNKEAVEVPFGLDAPSKGLRQITSGGWELLALIKYGMGSMVFFIPGSMCGYLSVIDGLDSFFLAVAIVSLAISVFLARQALHAAKNLRTIAQA